MQIFWKSVNILTKLQWVQRWELFWRHSEVFILIQPMTVILVLVSISFMKIILVPFLFSSDIIMWF